MMPSTYQHEHHILSSGQQNLMSSWNIHYTYDMQIFVFCKKTSLKTPELLPADTLWSSVLSAHPYQKSVWLLVRVQGIHSLTQNCHLVNALSNPN